jgi:hypothetical protein
MKRSAFPFVRGRYARVRLCATASRSVVVRKTRETWPLPLSDNTRRIVMPRAANQATARSRDAAHVGPS